MLAANREPRGWWEWCKKAVSFIPTPYFGIDEFPVRVIILLCVLFLFFTIAMENALYQLLIALALAVYHHWQGLGITGKVSLTAAFIILTTMLVDIMLESFVLLFVLTTMLFFPKPAMDWFSLGWNSPEDGAQIWNSDDFAQGLLENDRDSDDDDEDDNNEGNGAASWGSNTPNRSESTSRKGDGDGNGNGNGNGNGTGKSGSAAGEDDCSSPGTSFGSEIDDTVSIASPDAVRPDLQLSVSDMRAHRAPPPPPSQSLSSSGTGMDHSAEHSAHLVGQLKPPSRLTISTSPYTPGTPKTPPGIKRHISAGLGFSRGLGRGLGQMGFEWDLGLSMQSPPQPQSRHRSRSRFLSTEEDGIQGLLGTTASFSSSGPLCRDQEVYVDSESKHEPNSGTSRNLLAPLETSSSSSSSSYSSSSLTAKLVAAATPPLGLGYDGQGQGQGQNNQDLGYGYSPNKTARDLQFECFASSFGSLASSTSTSHTSAAATVTSRLSQSQLFPTALNSNSSSSSSSSSNKNNGSNGHGNQQRPFHLQQPPALTSPIMLGHDELVDLSEARSREMALSLRQEAEEMLEADFLSQAAKNSELRVKRLAQMQVGVGLSPMPSVVAKEQEGELGSPRPGLGQGLNHS